MPAYLREVHAPKCLCGKPSSVQVFNRFNASVGYWCRKCGEKRVAELNREDEERAKAAKKEKG